MNTQILLSALLALLVYTSSAQAGISRVELGDEARTPIRDYVKPTFGKEERNPRSAVRTINGSATKGPIANAAISVYEIDDTGATIGSAVATSTSDSSGEFSVSLPASAFGMLMVETSGGSFIDESDTRPLTERRRISLGSNEGFRSIILNSQSTVAVTPYTEALVERALGSSRFGGFKTKMQELMDASTQGFGFSVFDTLPANPAAPASDAGSAAKQYALLLGATANIANVAALKMGMAAPTFDVLQAMVYDLSDGSTDGLRFGEPILVNGKVFPSIDFDQQIIRFRNNNFASYADVSIPEWDTAEEDLGGVFGPGEIFSYVVDPIPRRWGISVFGAARSLRKADGTGTHWNAIGPGDYLWGEVDDELILDFTPFGGKENGGNVFFRTNDQGVQEEIRNTTFIDRLVFSFGEGGLQVAVSGRFEQFNVETSQVEFTFPFDEDPVPIRFANKANIPTIEDEPPAFEESPAFPQLGDGQLPSSAVPEYVFVDEMTFSADGTGVTSYDGDTFRWQWVDNRKGIKIDFDNGESAAYYPIFLDDPDNGDFVGADYISPDGTRRFFLSSIVISNFDDLVFTQDRVVRQFRAAHSSEIDGDARAPYDRRLNFYPDGTGVQEFIGIFDFESGDHIMARGGFCWEIQDDGVLTMRLSEFDFNRGFVPTPEDCQNLVSDDLFFRWDWELYDEFNGNFQFVFSERFSDTIDEPGLIPGIAAIVQAQPVFTARPPIPVDDVHSTTALEPITIDPFSNDVAGTEETDPTTVEITSGPLNLSTFSAAQGSVSVDPATGAITYTPDTSDTSFRDVEMNYLYRDVAGNITSQGRVFITIGEPPASPRPKNNRFAPDPDNERMRR